MVNDGGALLGEQVVLDPERLAYWYFRLNGFLTTVNFVVHPEEGAEPRTDADILGVRFPYREELLTNPLTDDPIFVETRPYVVMAEVKTGRCKLNGPWTRRHDENVQRVLAAIGAIPRADWNLAAQAIYDEGVYESPQVYITLCCLGCRVNQYHREKYPRVPQILWPHVAGFIYGRFHAYLLQKLAHQQWDTTGHVLYRLVRDAPGPEAFTRTVLDGIAAFRERQESKGSPA